MKKIKYIFASLAMVLSLGLMSPIVVGAQEVDPCEVDLNGYLCKHAGDDLMTYVSDIVNTVIYVLGFLAVVMLIYAGVMYVTSAGDANKVAKAKNTIMYAVIGLVIAILSYAVVNFVISAL